MRPLNLIVRCFAEHRNGVWQGFCIDLGLAVQGENLEDVRQKLRDQIKDYVFEAVAGPDKEHAHQLLQRKSPLYLRARYHYYRLLGIYYSLVGRSGKDDSDNHQGGAFGSPMPLCPT